MSLPLGFTWGNMLWTIIRMAAWGIVLGGLFVAGLIAVTYLLAWLHGYMADQDVDEPWLPAERRRWRP